MKRTRLGGLDVVLAGGTDGRGGGDGPCLVLLHGFGAPGEDLVPLFPSLALPAGARAVFPAAPLDLGLPFSDGRAWWMLDIGRLQRELRLGDEPSALREVSPARVAARARVRELLEALGPPSRLVLGGFSQGSMLACDVAQSGVPLAGLVILSGTLLADDRWTRPGLRVFQSHGRYDPLLPFAAAQRLRAVMEDGGADVRFEPFDGAHEIPEEVLGSLNEFLGEVL